MSGMCSSLYRFSQREGVTAVEWEKTCKAYGDVEGILNGNGFCNLTMLRIYSAKELNSMKICVSYSLMSETTGNVTNGET